MSSQHSSHASAESQPGTATRSPGTSENQPTTLDEVLKMDPEAKLVSARLKPKPD